MKFFSRLVVLTLIIGMGFTISACGQKGPLFMSAKPPAVSTPYPVAAPHESAPTPNQNQH